MNDQSPLGKFTLVQWIIFGVVLAGILAVAYVGTQAFGIPIPIWVWRILWICIGVVIIVGAIKFLATLLRS